MVRFTSKPPHRYRFATAPPRRLVFPPTSSNAYIQDPLTSTRSHPRPAHIHPLTSKTRSRPPAHIQPRSRPAHIPSDDHSPSFHHHHPTDIQDTLTSKTRSYPPTLTSKTRSHPTALTSKTRSHPRPARIQPRSHPMTLHPTTLPSYATQRHTARNYTIKRRLTSTVWMQCTSAPIPGNIPCLRFSRPLLPPVNEEALSARPIEKRWGPVFGG